MNDLLDAVDRLTNKVRVRLSLESHRHDWQPVREPSRWKLNRDTGTRTVVVGDVIPGHWYCTHCNEESTDPTQLDHSEQTAIREDPNPLEQLRQRVANSIGEGSGGSQQAKDRVPLDLSSFALYERIDGIVRAWLLDIGDPVDGDLAAGLRRWYSAYTRYPRDADELDRYRTVLDGWWDEIRDIIDPPTRQEITEPCPVCGASLENAAEGEGRPLWALWRESDDDSDARCLRCGTRWRGVMEMRTLRGLLDDAASLRAAEHELQPAD